MSSVRALFFVCSVLGLLSLGCGGTKLATQPAVDAEAPALCTPEDEPCRTAAISDARVGDLRADLATDTVVAMFGEPDRKDETWLEEASGVWVQDWHWPAQGVEITMGAGTENGVQTVYNYTVRAPFAGVTERGIGIGASEAAVREAYATLADPDFTTPGKMFIAGSIYGGVFFQFEDDQVVSIFVGAGAE